MLKNIEYEQAQKILINHAKPLPGEYILLTDAPGRVIAKNIFAPHDHPSAYQSAFDGFALCGLDRGLSFRVVKFSSGSNFNLKPGEAAHVGTGDILPQGSEAVAPLEQVSVSNKQIELQKGIKPGGNIKNPGEDFKKGDLLAAKGTCFTAELTGLLAAFGFKQVLATCQPRVLVLSLGANIVPYEQAPQTGEIRDSNGPLISSLVKKQGGQVTGIEVWNHTVEHLPNLAKLLQKSDLIITTGSTFVGTGEDGRRPLEKLGATYLFSGAKLTPGGHVTAALWYDKLILMLSGNPAACLVGFELFAVPVLRLMQGLSPTLTRIHARLTAPFSKQKNVRNFLRAYAECNQTGWEVTILPGQKPSMMRSFLGYNALIDLAPNHPPFEKGEQIPVILSKSFL